jgi:hypothetical protein
MSGTSGKAHGSSFTLRGVVIPSALGAGDVAGASQASASGRPLSATKKNKRDLQVVITSDSGSRPATTQDSTAARSSGALGRSSGRRVPFDAHGDRHLSRPRDAARGANFPTSKAPLSAVFYSFWLLFGRAITSRSGLEAWMLFLERARAARSR